jgi:Raf kinase inhibitor-like YbhB/YbcL family protein
MSLDIFQSSKIKGRKLRIFILAANIQQYLLLFRNKNLNKKPMQITSPAFKNGERIPSKYTCEGTNISPPLRFIDVPKEAKTLVLMVEDPDAKAKPWVHWLVFNIPSSSIGFDENAISKNATQGLCNGNTFGYEGPCPPQGQHDYLFKLYALNVALDIPATSDRKKVLQAMEGHVLAEATLVGKYQKQNSKAA